MYFLVLQVLPQVLLEVQPELPEKRRKPSWYAKIPGKNAAIPYTPPSFLSKSGCFKKSRAVNFRVLKASLTSPTGCINKTPRAGAAAAKFIINRFNRRNLSFVKNAETQHTQRALGKGKSPSAGGWWISRTTAAAAADVISENGRSIAHPCGWVYI
jgi:hypothetical protein